MKKIIPLVAALLLWLNCLARFTALPTLHPDTSFTPPSYADVNHNYRNYANNVFGLLEANRVPTGLLLDYAFDFTEPKIFNGVTLHDSTLVEPGIFAELYKTIFTSRFNNNVSLRHPHVHDSLFYIARQQQVITLSGLLFTYNAIDPYAQTNGKLQEVNGQLKDKYTNGVWQNPYQQFTTLAITPSVIRYSRQGCSVVLPQNLWLSNIAGTVSSIQFDAGDGSGYRTLTFNTPVSISYADSGWKHWQFKINRTGGQTALYTHTKVYFGKVTGSGANTRTAPGTPVSARGSVQDLTQTIWANEAYSGKTGKANIIVSYRNAADPVIRRPLIVAEGFDPGHITEPEEEEGSNSFNNFTTTIDFSESADLQSLISNNPSAYDIIYINWSNGTDFLQRNAFVLEAVVRWVNAQKQPLNGVRQPNVVLGSSMGGLIARMALGRMDRGQGSFNGTGGFAAHETSLYISVDAPHQGANVPLGIQAAARHAVRQYITAGPAALTTEYVMAALGQGSPQRTLLLADEPAARQMLINRLDIGYNISNSDHTNFQNELRTQWAYPVNIRNVAISNGNECGIDQEITAGSSLLYFNRDIKTRFLGDLIDVLTGGAFASAPLGALSPVIPYSIPGSNRFKITLDIRTLANGGGNQVYYGNISYTKKILWLLPVTHNIANRTYNAPSGLLPFDTYPGGFFTIPVTGSPSSSFSFVLFDFNSSFTVKRRFAFVHTTSALDIGGGSQTITNTQYTARYVGAAPPAAPFNTPFQNFTTAFNTNGSEWIFENDTRRRLNNEPHESFFIRTANWLAAEINRTGTSAGPASNCSALCNVVITGAGTLCTSATYSVPAITDATYTWSATPSGSVTFSGSGNSVTVTRSASFNGNVTIRATIDLPVCGSVSATTNVIAGPPAASITSVDAQPSPYGQIDVRFSLPTSGATVTSYNFFVDGSSVKSSSGSPSSPTTMNGGSCGSHSVVLSLTSACGTSSSNAYYYERNCSGGGYGYYMFNASPNPTNDGQMNIEATDDNSNQAQGETLANRYDEGLNDGTTGVNKRQSQASSTSSPAVTKRKLYKILVTDISGTKKKQFDYPNGTTKTVINIAELPNGIYTISVFDGVKWNSRKVKKQ